MLQAQVYTTSSASYRSISTSGMASSPTTSAFRSTSMYVGSGSSMQTTSTVSYSTAPMRIANGTITTVASQLQGGVMVDSPSDYEEGMSPKQRAVIPGVPNLTPLGDGWDVAVLLALMCLGYAIYVRRKVKTEK